MASSARAIGFILIALILLPLMAVSLAGGGLRLSAADLGALRFTLIQSFWSALISVVLAIGVARALARRRFWGRNLLISLMGAPFLLPVIVAVMGLLALFGRAGLINQGLVALGGGRISIYGLHGVVLAHVFLNLPLATRMILQGWQSIPAERFRLAQSLDFSPRDYWRHLEWPLLKALLPGVFATIFAICLSSFAVALILGGGPSATTIELAIYQAVRFEFDLSHAAALAVLQSLIGAVAAGLAWVLAKDIGFGAGIRTAPIPAPSGFAKGMDAIWILGAALFLVLPLAAVLLQGLGNMADLPKTVWAAAGRSVIVALVSAIVTACTALFLALARAKGRGIWLELAALLPLATSGLVLGVGLFLLVQPVMSPVRLALGVTVLVNVLMSLPFAFRLLLPDAKALVADYDRLAQSLDLRGLSALRYLIWPKMARALGFAAGLSAALSMGDLGVIALFASDQTATLPLVVQQLAGSYRTSASSAAAVLLVGLSFALFYLFDAGGRRADPR